MRKISGLQEPCPVRCCFGSLAVDIYRTSSTLHLWDEGTRNPGHHGMRCNTSEEVLYPHLTSWSCRKHAWLCRCDTWHAGLAKALVTAAFGSTAGIWNKGVEQIQTGQGSLTSPRHHLAVPSILRCTLVKKLTRIYIENHKRKI